MPKNQKPTGPKPERVSIQIPWSQAVKAALGKKRPAEGWPKTEKPKKKDS
jgi:hypothetical protein